MFSLGVFQLVKNEKATLRLLGRKIKDSGLDVVPGT